MRYLEAIFFFFKDRGVRFSTKAERGREWGEGGGIAMTVIFYVEV